MINVKKIFHYLGKIFYLHYFVLGKEFVYKLGLESKETTASIINKIPLIKNIKLKVSPENTTRSKPATMVIRQEIRGISFFLLPLNN